MKPRRGGAGSRLAQGSSVKGWGSVQSRLFRELKSLVHRYFAAVVEPLRSRFLANQFCLNCAICLDLIAARWRDLSLQHYRTLPIRVTSGVEQT